MFPILQSYLMEKNGALFNHRVEAKGHPLCVFSRGKVTRNSRVVRHGHTSTSVEGAVRSRVSPSSHTVVDRPGRVYHVFMEARLFQDVRLHVRAYPRFIVRPSTVQAFRVVNLPFPFFLSRPDGR